MYSFSFIYITLLLGRVRVELTKTEVGCFTDSLLYPLAYPPSVTIYIIYKVFVLPFISKKIARRRIELRLLE
jgi:hypothetical protein